MSAQLNGGWCGQENEMNLRTVRKSSNSPKQLKSIQYFFSGRPGMKPLPKKATRNVTMAALLIEEVTRQLARE